MLQIIYYIIISVLSLFLINGFIKKRNIEELTCYAILIVTFVLRALHIK